MKLSISLVGIFLTSAFALSVKRQNGVPDCIDGDRSGVDDSFGSSEFKQPGVDLYYSVI